VMRPRDPMRRFAWMLVAGGLLLAVSYPFFAEYETERQIDRWHRRELDSANPVRAQRLVEMLREGRVPSDTVVAWWPGVLSGLALSAFGVLLLAIRRPLLASSSGTAVAGTPARTGPRIEATTTPVQQAPVFLKGNGAYDLLVVGESKYQDALEEICGGRTKGGHEFPCAATLIYEDENPHDSRAVRVAINGRTVGYLSRDMAPRYRAAMDKAGQGGRVAQCEALIVGGWDRGEDARGHFGVKLDVPVEP
jgi:hypothetical protein